MDNVDEQQIEIKLRGSISHSKQDRIKKEYITKLQIGQYSDFSVIKNQEVF